MVSSQGNFPHLVARISPCHGIFLFKWPVSWLAIEHVSRVMACHQKSVTCHGFHRQCVTCHGLPSNMCHVSSLAVEISLACAKFGIALPHSLELQISEMRFPLSFCVPLNADIFIFALSRCARSCLKIHPSPLLVIHLDINIA